MRKWNRTRDILPKEHVIVETKIDDGNGCRNQQNLYRYGNLWFFPDGSMYVYYTPTHWREMKRGGEQEEIMKYMIETTEDGCVEVLELHDGSKYTKRHVKTAYGSQCEDQDFREQMEEDGICEEILDKVFYVLDGFLPSEFMDIAELDS